MGLTVLPLGEFMKKISIKDYFDIAALIEALSSFGGDANYAKERVAGKALNMIKEQLDKAIEHTRAIGMTHTAAIAQHTKKQLSSGKMLFKEAKLLFDCLGAQAENEVSTVFIGYVPPDHAAFWDVKQPFGDKVYGCFPSARNDAVSAGNCYAVEQYDACVFYLMRVVEKGLRALAKERGIKKIGKTHVDWNEWGRIIGALRNKADEIDRDWHRGRRKDMALEFYRGAIGELEAFKDAYRNYVMHDRFDYDQFQAGRVYHRVDEFMQRLSVHLSEDRKGAIKWPR
jgi:hypothetical protein